MRRLWIAVAALVLAAGCGGSTGSPGPSTGPDGFALRAWVSQALPPAGAFRGAGPTMAVDRGRLITHGAVPAIYPGPLMPNLQQREISDAGVEAIIAAARAAGLLEGPTDLTGGLPPGAQTAHLLFRIDGVEREVLGDPTRQIICITTPCDGAPGTPEGFGQFWARVQDLAFSMPGELGPEQPFVVERLAVLLTEPVLDATLPPSFQRWPLGGPMSEFGVAWAGNPPVRCGVIEGDDLVGALAAFRSASELTRWTDDSNEVFGVVARPLFPGEDDPC